MPARFARLVALLPGVLVMAGCVIATAPPSSHPVPAPPPVAPAHQASIEVSFFHDAMDPYGDWLWVAPHGWVWAPAAVDPFWRPYTMGRWAWTDHGWTWVSDEPWGWAAYHYGRWARVPRHGWIWVPGNVWGPAWVAWRDGPGVIGWAPLPPQVGYRAGVGLDVAHVNIDVVIRPEWWCFVDEARVIEPRVYRHAYPVGRNVTVIRRTKNVIHIHEKQGRVFHEAPGHQRVESAVRRPVPRYRVVDADARREGPDEIRRDEMHVWRPKVREEGSQTPPRRGFGRPQAEPENRHKAETERPEPAPLPQAAPAVEKRIEKNWERDWRRLQQMQRQEARKAEPAPDRDHTLVHERDENASAADNAYQEQQAQRARAQREAEKPRPVPARVLQKKKGQGNQAGKDQGKGQEKDKDDRKD